MLFRSSTSQAREFYEGFINLNPDYAKEHKFIRSEEAAPKDVEKIDEDDKDKELAIISVKTELKLQNAHPTIIRAKFLVGEKDVEVPLAIKAFPHYIGKTEFEQLMDAAIEDRRILTRYIKLTTGEISFFKDFLFNMDRAKRDANLYKQFGRHPWYQQFLKQKSADRKSVV